jgi:hypothetical protein
MVEQQERVEVDFAPEQGETSEQALALMTEGFELEARVVQEEGPAAKLPVAELTGTREQVVAFLTKWEYDLEAHGFGA